MQRLATLVIAIVGAGTPGVTDLHSQAQAGQTVLGLGAGATLIKGGLDDVAKTGWGGTAQLGYEMPSGVGIRADFYYGQNGAEAGGGKFKFVGGLGNVTYTLDTSGRAGPYLIGTVGMMNTRFAGFDGNTEATFGGGAGVVFRNGPASSFFVEARYLTVNSDGDNINLIPIQVGIRLGI